MPRVPLHRALATKASITALFAMAEAEGFVEVFVDSEAKAKLLRNKCYAWRSRIRKQGLALTSVETSPYDGYSFPIEYDPPTGKWRFRIDSDEEVEFELIVEEGVEVPNGFDWCSESDVPQVSLEQAEEKFHGAVNEYYKYQDDDIPF